MRKADLGRWLGILSAAVLAVDAGLSPASRTWQAMACMALLAALGLAGWRLAALLLPGESLLSRVTAAFSLAMAVGTVGATVLGHLGWLTPRLFELLAGCGAALSLLAPRPETSPGEVTRWRPAILPLLSLILLAAFTLSQMVAYGDSPPGTLSYDDLSYHLPAVATWLHNHDLRMMKPSFGDQGTTFYPIGSELWSWILVAPFRDSDVLARWSQLPFALFSLVAVAAVARRLGLSGPTTTLAVVFYWSLPRTVELGLTAGSDHSLAFFMIAGVDAALLLARRQDWRRAVYAGVVLGLLLSTKYIAVLFAPLLVLVWLAARRDARQEAQSLGLAAVVSLVLVVAAITGGYTYLRSAVVTGNPLFPAPVELFGQRLLPGWPEASPSARRAGRAAAICCRCFGIAPTCWVPCSASPCSREPWQRPSSRSGDGGLRAGARPWRSRSSLSASSPRSPISTIIATCATSSPLSLWRESRSAERWSRSGRRFAHVSLIS